jgi:SAM-dependent methyltransferase
MLDLRTFTIEKNSSPQEIKSGMLHCEMCGRVYPIVDGIPRMLPDSADEFADMMEGFGIPRHTRRENKSHLEQFRQLHDATRQASTFESLHYSSPGFDENCRFFENATGYSSRQLSGKTVLDAGCGTGRFMEVAASMGAHVVGIDLSRSVDRAYRDTRFKPQTDFIQGDVMNPPLRSESFDALYSIDVLNHTPDTRQAFQSISQLLRPGGRAAIWMDQRFLTENGNHACHRFSTRLSQELSDGMRVVTTRLPHRMLHYACVGLAPIGELKRIAGTNRILKSMFAPILLLPVSDHPNWSVRLGNIFTWFAPPNQWKHTTQEVLSWFEAEGYEAVHPLNRTAGASGDRPVAGNSMSPDPENARSQHAYAGR